MSKSSTDDELNIQEAGGVWNCEGEAAFFVMTLKKWVEMGQICEKAKFYKLVDKETCEKASLIEGNWFEKQTQQNFDVSRKNSRSSCRLENPQQLHETPNSQLK